MPETPPPSDNRGEKPQPAPAAADTTAPSSADYSGVIGAIIFWLIIAAVIYWWVAPHNQAQLALEASPKQPRHISGMVTFNGAPVSKGTVNLVFDDPKRNYYLGGSILPVTPGGIFTTTGHELPAGPESEAQSPEPLRVTATFTGQEPEKKDKDPIAITGKTVLFLNYPPSIGRMTIWCFVFVTTAMAIILITLFTGDLTRRKARILFSITYLMTFMSLAVPIGSIIMVSKSQYAVEMMEEAPVGLVKGTAKGIQRPQWLVNLGGAVLTARSETLAEKEASSKAALPDQPPAESARPVSPSPTQSQGAVALGKSPPPGRPQPTPAQELGRADELRPTPGFALVQGGLAVPFYVIILAMLGAGINMTKKVPDIQNRHDIKRLPRDTQSMVAAALQAPVSPFLSGERRDKTAEEVITVSGIRKELIDNYMGLISAPFLAIAVYYLLQIIATNIAEPVLVLMAFATGFISDSIVTAITTFASDMIDKWKAKRGEQPPPPQKPSPAA